MTQYEKMARRVVKDGLIAMTNFNGKYEEDEPIIDSFTDAIMLGLKELLKEDKIHVYDPDKLMSNLG